MYMVICSICLTFLIYIIDRTCLVIQITRHVSSIRSMFALIIIIGLMGCHPFGVLPGRAQLSNILILQLTYKHFVHHTPQY